MRFTVGHIKQCEAINAKCSNCQKIGHFTKVCQQRETNDIDTNVNDTSEEETDLLAKYLECKNYSKCTKIFNYPEKQFYGASFCQNQQSLNTY